VPLFSPPSDQAHYERVSPIPSRTRWQKRPCPPTRQQVPEIDPHRCRARSPSMPGATPSAPTRQPAALAAAGAEIPPLWHDPRRACESPPSDARSRLKPARSSRQDGWQVALARSAGKPKRHRCCDRPLPSRAPSANLACSQASSGAGPTDLLLQPLGLPALLRLQPLHVPSEPEQLRALRTPALPLVVGQLVLVATATSTLCAIPLATGAPGFTRVSSPARPRRLQGPGAFAAAGHSRSHAYLNVDSLNKTLLWNPSAGCKAVHRS